jgi:hypothetical protein
MMKEWKAASQLILPTYFYILRTGDGERERERVVVVLMALRELYVLYCICYITFSLFLGRSTYLLENHPLSTVPYCLSSIPIHSHRTYLVPPWWQGARLITIPYIRGA